jgi:hypothetical protein
MKEVTLDERVALAQVHVLPMPLHEPKTEEELYARAYQWAIHDVEPLLRAAVQNYKLTGREEDFGRMKGIAACIERMKERRFR